MRKIIVLIIISCYSLFSYAQTARPTLFVPYLSSAQVSPEFAGAASFCDNPSVFPRANGFGAGIYSEKKFMVDDLNVMVISAAIFRAKSGAGISFRYYGSPVYNEVQLGMHYGRTLGKITIGTGIYYNTLSVQGSEKIAVIDFNISGTCKLSENLYAGLFLANPRISKSVDRSVASRYKTGFGYQPSSKVYAGFEFFKEENKNLEVIACLQYYVAGQFFTRTGFISGSGMPFFGAGWIRSHLKIEIIIGVHAALGTSPALFLNYLKQEGE